jgi:catechol 2,3-dioxygenase-like lactoylglutathione lyase family enzyme
MARKLRLIHSPTPDWDAVRSFYRDVLGLEETGGWDQPGDRGSFLAAGTAEIEVMELDAAPDVLPEPARGWQLALEVDDLDAEVTRLRDGGVEIAQEIRARPWGGRDFVVRDPTGRMVLIFTQ